MATETGPAAAAAPRLLLGPPLVRAARPSPASDDAPESHPFLDLLDAAFNAPSAAEAKAALAPRRARTENCNATYANSGDPCVDFFFHVVPSTPAARVRELLAAAWARDPLTALKLACNLRGVRGTGKSDREGFYAAALWVHDHHPRTLACNVAALAEFGYLKDFPELLFRLVRGQDVRRLAKEGAAADKARREGKQLAEQRVGLRARLAGRKRAREAATRSVTEAAEQKPEAMEVDQKKASKRGVPKKVRTMAKLAVQSLETYYGDRAYRFLFDAVADFFAALLASDMRQMAPGGKKRKIGLAAKWCPTPGSSFDRATLLCEAIACRLFPRDSDPEYAELSDEHYSYRVLRRLRREVLVPIRKALELPEVYMCAQRWDELPYARVAPVAMRRYKALFQKHDEERFAKYLEDVEASKAKIAAGAVLPHEIAAAAYRGEEDEVAELQWRRMVDDLRAKGSLRNCMSICDVSGSMEGTPMEVAIALGVLTSELSEEPWAGKVITFHTRPSIHVIKGETLRDKMRFVAKLEWHGSTNFQGVFDRILATAREAQLPPEKMVRTVFVYSDMEFGEACGRGVYNGMPYGEGSWDTDYAAICRKFRDAGYGDAVPQVVFWNLRDSKSTPVTSTQPGAAMVSGFSKNVLKIFLQNDGVVNPEAIMSQAIAGDEYQKLQIYD
ncbi:hypothetical protein ACQJBY_067011 [Aegilops geniculata]